MLEALRGRPWSDEAACRTEDPELFYAHGVEGMKMSVPQIAEAKAICNSCPVRRECLDWAIEHGETEHGIWGGKTPHERRAEARRRRTAWEVWA